MASLIVTNGSSAARSIEQVRPMDHFLSWDDVLHVGPVPSELALEQMSGIRARFLWRSGWGAQDEIAHAFESRDRRFLTAYEEYDELVLWFEHDLYDQLQLIQCLSILGQDRNFRRSRMPISMICQDHFISESPSEVLEFDFRDREPVRDGQFELAMQAWEAFTHFAPLRLQAFYENANFTGLMYLRPALKRWFEEYPSAMDGLTRTERTVLHRMSEGVSSSIELFSTVQAVEEAKFMGDAVFWQILQEMSKVPSYLIRTTDGTPYNPQSSHKASFMLTEFGERALSGLIVESRMLIDRWMGGTHLRPGNCWYWNPYEESFQNDLL